jgi:hypothetical protein
MREGERVQNEFRTSSEFLSLNSTGSVLIDATLIYADTYAKIFFYQDQLIIREVSGLKEVKSTAMNDHSQEIYQSRRLSRPPPVKSWLNV